MRLNGKTCIVTGGASGFGLGMVERFLEEGAEVAILDLNEDGAKAAAKGDKALALRCDVTDAASVGTAVEATVERFGKLDVVVNNAGWSHRNQDIMGVSEEEFDKVYDVNVKSIFHMTRAVVPLWRAAGGGAMINIGSTAGIRPRPGLTWYNSSKGAVNLMSRSLAVDLAPDNIRVNCIAPVIGATALLEQFMGAPDTPELRAKFAATIPLGRFSTPRDIANAALYLASDEAAFITGVILEVDGGRTI